MSAEEIITNILLKYYECMEENDKFESEEKCLSIIVDGAAESTSEAKILEEKLKEMKQKDMEIEQKIKDLNHISAELKKEAKDLWFNCGTVGRSQSKRRKDE